MSKGREIRYFDYVNHPYAPVSAALSTDALGVFQAATRSATSRAKSVASALHVQIAGVEVATDIAITVEGVEEKPAAAKTTPTTTIKLSWEAAKNPALFPFMNAELLIYPLTPTETQLEIAGHYVPPGGPLGKAIDAVVGHRIAEASVHSFITDVAGYLRQNLS